MTALTVIDVASGDPVDRVTLDGDELEYETGVARDMFESLEAVGLTPVQAFDARTGWSNGYIRITADEAVTAAFRFDPDQPRDPDGKWGDGLPGSPGGGDRLQLGGRIDLAPGERLLGSAKVKIQNDNNESEMFVAATDGPGGRQLRVGIPPPDYSDPEYDDEGERIERVAWTGDDPADTVRLDAAGLDQMRADFDRHTATAKAWQAEANRNFDAIERLEARYHQLYSEASDRRDPETSAIAPEDRAKIDAVRAELEPLYDWQEAFEPDAMLAEGVIPGVPGHGELAYEIEGDDLGKFGWAFRFAVRPSDAPSDWSIRDSDAIVMSAADQARFQRQIASMIDSAVTAATSMAFDPNQPRDREGKWTDGPAGGAGGTSALDSWSAQSTVTAGLDDARIMQLGGDIGRVMARDGTTMADAGAFYDAATEALAGSDVTPRQYATALDERYGTAMAERVEAALRQRGDTPAVRPTATLELPDDDALPKPSGPDASETSFPAITVSDSNENWRDIESGWTDEQRKALQTYTSLAYSDINRALWEGRGNRGLYADTIREVRSAMTPSPVSQTTYRRTSGKSFGLPEFASTDELRGLVGTTVQNPGFTSTTVDESVLADHPAVVHMQIEVPRGTSSAWVHNVGLDHDGELLLDANTRYEVLSVDPMGSFETLMRVRIVP